MKDNQDILGLMENKIQHIQMIQDIINRVSGNSFMLKGWAVTLIAGIFTLSNNDTDKFYFLIAYIPIIIFWGLDSYYLRQERLFRNLYDVVREKNAEQVDFSMDTSVNAIQSKTTTYWSCFLSETELWFYFPLAVLSAIIIVITHN